MILTSSTAFAQVPGGPPKHQATRHHGQARALAISNGPPQFGAPLPGLTPAQLLDFSAGLDEFENVEDAEGGLGPVFNNVSCVSCHSSGATGGGGAVTVTRFGRFANGQFDPLTSRGGSLLQQRAIAVEALENVPAEANVIAHRQSTPLFGLGLIEAIADADILRNAQRPQVDGIRGRAVMVHDVVSGTQRVGRFGWKAQLASVLAFAGDAYLNEMGITSRFFPVENAPNGDLATLAAFDHLSDPEDVPDSVTGKGDIDVAADFMRFLAPPPTLPLTPSANAGRQVFQQLNCAACHQPLMITGPNPVAALSQKPVALFSDLLVHDMGALGDGIVQGAAGPREMRTAPLWGLRASAPYLHDGRASTLDDAIRAHDGEAKNARDRYRTLNPLQRQQLMDFLNSI
ncbi:MAG: di-heme oxidoredictase family protein [Chthoniobacteraceae bacterium]